MKLHLVYVETASCLMKFSYANIDMILAVPSTFS